MLEYVTPQNVRTIMGLSFFPLGMVAMLSGLIMLIAGPYRQEAKLLAAQSARLGSLRLAAEQKGIADGLSDLTRSATALIDSVNNLIRTSSGNAIVVIVFGAVSEAASYWLLVGS